MAAVSFWNPARFGDERFAVEAAPNTSVAAVGPAAADRGEAARTHAALVARNVPHAATPPAAEPGSTFLAAENLNEALQDAIARFGTGDARVRSFYLQTKQACEERIVDRARETALPTPADPSKEAARQELDRRCAGFEPSVLDPGEHAPPGFHDYVHLLGRQEAERLATEALLGANNAFDVFNAGEFLLGSGAFPTEDAFGTREISAERVSQALWHAALLGECERAGQCGPRSFATIALCARYGCAPSDDMERVLHGALSPRDYAAVMATRRWLARHVRSRSS